MARFSGRSMYLTFSTSTITNLRSVDIEEQAAEIDASAAGDTRETYVAGLIGSSLSAERVGDDADTTLYNAVAPQSTGTIIFGPAGTASGKRKYTWGDTVSLQRNEATPYDGVNTMSLNFRLNVAPTVGTW